MGMRTPAVYTWAPSGISDARTGAAFEGACRQLTNLIQDPTTPGVMAPRPAALQLTNFTGFTTPGVVNLAVTVGTRIYGLLTTGRNVGYDEPFCYDTATSSFVTISGVTSSNTPLTPATTGDWTPPTAALVGVYLVVTYPTAAAPNYFYWFDLTNPAAPVWNAGNTSSGYLKLTQNQATAGAGNAPVDVQVSYDNAFVYAVNNKDGTISQYNRNRSTGVLTNILPAAMAGIGNAPTALALSNDGISGYIPLSSVNVLGVATRNITSGVLTAAAVSTVATGTTPISAVVSPDNTSVYVANQGSATLSQFSRNTANGVLTALSPATVATGTAPTQVRISLDGTSVYAVNKTSNTISQFSRNTSTGVLTAMTPATVSTGTTPTALAISTDGTSVYVCDNGSATLSIFTRNTSTGALTANGSVATGNQPSSVVVSPDGQNVYVSNYTDGTVSQYARNAGTGALTVLNPPSYNYGSTNNINALAMPSDGLTLYGADTTQNVVGWVSRIVGSALLLTTPPSAVASYFDRAWYLVGNMVYFSDPLNPFMMTDAGQAITVGNSVGATALVPQPLTTGTQGILNALLVFKPSSIWQITGDYSLNTLADQELTASVGCSAPRTIQPTPEGVFFMAVDGLRTVSLSGTLSEPNPDLVFPFSNATTPSRAVACYASDTYRISLTATNALGTTGAMDYWYSLRFKKWTGPHSLPYNAATALGSSTVIASNSVPGVLFKGNTFPTTGDTYTENGVALTTTLISCPVSPNPPMAEKAAVEMEAYALPGAPSSSYQINVYDVLGENQVSTSFGPYSATYLWGNTTWGGGTWSAPTYNLPVWPVFFSQPIVFKSGIIQITGNPSATARSGPVRFRYEAMGYTGAD